MCYSETSVGSHPVATRAFWRLALTPQTNGDIRGAIPEANRPKGFFFGPQTGLHPLASADIGAAWKKTEILDRWLLKGPFARRNRPKKGHGGNAGGGVAGPVSSQPVLLDLAGQAEQILKNGYCGGLTLNPSKDTYCLNFE